MTRSGPEFLTKLQTQFHKKAGLRKPYRKLLGSQDILLPLLELQKTRILSGTLCQPATLSYGKSCRSCKKQVLREELNRR